MNGQIYLNLNALTEFKFQMAFLPPPCHGKSDRDGGLPMELFDMYVKKVLSPKTYLEILNYTTQ